jgi:hypothetical protein
VFRVSTDLSQHTTRLRSMLLLLTALAQSHLVNAVGIYEAMVAPG